MLAVVLASTIWVALDAARNPYVDTPTWVVAVFLFWIIAFPAYLIRRSQDPTKRKHYSITPKAAELERLERLKRDRVLSLSEWESKRAQVLGHQPPVAVPPADYLDRLQTPTELRDAGALTPDEFETEKARILSSSS